MNHDDIVLFLSCLMNLPLKSIYDAKLQSISKIHTKSRAEFYIELLFHWVVLRRLLKNSEIHFITILLKREKGSEKVILLEKPLGIHRKCFPVGFFIEKMFSLTHFWPMFLLYTPWKHQKTKGFSVYKIGTLATYGF